MRGSRRRLPTPVSFDVYLRLAPAARALDIMAFDKEWRAIWHRLAAVSWDELQTRAAQEITKRYDVARYRLGMVPAGVRLDHVASAQPHFFFSPGELPALIASLQERLTDEAKLILEDAEHVLQHRFNLLGYEGIDYGPDIDWHLDAVHGKRAPRRPWFKIGYLDFGAVGDHKITWELNRHQHLVTLAKAYCLTHQDRFVTELLYQWYDWQRENPYPIGINWVSSLEVAFRSLSWLWVRHLLAGSTAVPANFDPDLRRALALNGRHIERYLSTYFSPNTHLLGEAVGLFFLGTLAPEIRAAGRWQRRGCEIVLREAQRQVRADGFHFEQSVYYHVYALDFFLHARILAARNQIPIPAAFDQKLERMLEILRFLSQAGPPPRFGDDDGGRAFNPRRNRARHTRDPLSAGAILLGRGDFKAAAGGLTEEALWLLGLPGMAQFDELPAAVPAAVSVACEASGIYVMASSAPVPQQLVIQAGTAGIRAGGHSHADALSVQLSVNGQDWLADAGTFCYVSGDGERQAFRGTTAHNTLQVDGLSQVEPAGPFAWQSLPEIRVEEWAAGQTFDLFVGSHEGYRRLPHSVIHQRWVFHLKSRFWLVRDLALGEGVHQLELFWHFAPGFVPRQAQTGGLCLTNTQDEGLALLAPTGSGWSQEVIESSVSPVYGRKEPSLAVRFRAQVGLPAEFAVLAIAVGKTAGRRSDELGVFARLDGGAETAAVRGYQYCDPAGFHHMFFGKRGEPWELRPWTSDANFLYSGAAPEKNGQHWVLCGGSRAAFGGQKALEAGRLVGWCEWLAEKGSKRTFCSDQSAAVDYGWPVLNVGAAIDASLKKLPLS